MKSTLLYNWNGPSAPATCLFIYTFSLGPPDPRRRSEFENARMSVIFQDPQDTYRGSQCGPCLMTHRSLHFWPAHPKPGEVPKADVSKMYSNFFRFFVVETIDVFLFECVLCEMPDSLAHKWARRLRDIIMPLMIFLLEHIIISIHWKAGKEFYAQRQGLPTGGSFSDAIVTLCMWLCEESLLNSWHGLHSR